MGIVGALVGVLVLALGGGATQAAPVGGAHRVVAGVEAVNKHLAEVQAGRELRSIPVPPGARGVDAPPAPALEESIGTRGEPNLVQRRRWFVAPGTVSQVSAWFRHHRPAGSRIEEEASGGALSNRIWFGVEESSARVYGPSVIPTMTRLPRDRVAIRLEVQQVWKAPHPAAAKVPPAARVLQVSRRVGSKAPRWQRIHALGRVRQIARAIDHLPAKQPQVLYCPEDFLRESVLVRMFFRARVGGPLLAEASQRMPPYVCEAMTLKVMGAPRAFALEDGAEVIEALRR